MKIVTVVPLAKGTFRENLTYFTSRKIENGNIVSITLKNKKILGLVVATEDVSSTKGNIKDLQFNIKKIIEIKEDSIWRKEYLKSIFEINKYFAGRINDSASSLIPSFFREKYDRVAKIFLGEKSIHGLENKKEITVNIIKNIKTEKLFLQAPLEDRIFYYKTMIRGYFAKKKSVFMVLPTEFDIESFKGTLGKGIESFIFTMHGGLTKKNIYENLKSIASDSHPVLILGTAPFLSILHMDVGAIIVEHESANAYKMITKPYIDLRLFAEIFAYKINAKFILADTLLRFETIERKNRDGFGEVCPLSFRINHSGKIEILSRGEKFKVLLEKSIEKIKYATKNKKNVFIFSLRKGLATYTLCRDCNTTVSCKKCLSPVVLYLSRDGKKRMFVCNKCKKELSPETVCANCGSWNLVPLGIGVDTVYEELKKELSTFPKIKIFKLDKESVKSSSEAKKIVKEFENSPGSVLVGTEMAFFFLKEKVALSIIASFDSLWSIPNFKIGEKIIQIMLSIISKNKDNVVIQTKNEKDSALLAITKENLLPFIREELEDRKNFDYPPFKRFIKVTYSGNNKDIAMTTKQSLEKVFIDYRPEIFSSFISKNKNRYSINMLIKIDTEKWSLPELSTQSNIDQSLLTKLLSLPPIFSVNVDPEDLL